MLVATSQEATFQGISELVTLDNRPMLACVDLAAVRDLTDIEPVLQHMVVRAADDAAPANLLSGLGGAPLGANAFLVELLGKRRNRTKPQVPHIDVTDLVGFGLVHRQLALVGIIAERHATTHSHATCLRCRNLVANTGGDLSGLGEAPEGDQQLARHCADRDPARPALELTTREEAANKTRSKVRAVEHVFGNQQGSMGGKLVRTIGIVRAAVKIGMQNLAYNMRRLVVLERIAVAVG